MRDLARSMIRLSWAAPLCGVAQPSRLLAGPDGLLQLSSSLDAMTWTGHRHMDLGLQVCFQAGDDLGREWIDTFFDAFEPRAASAGLGPAMATMARRLGDTLRIAAPGEAGRVCRQELRNKLEVYFLVRSVRARLGLPPAGRPFELRPFVERALALDSYSALWVIEGLGHDYAAWHLAQGPAPAGILKRAEAPAPAMLMLHAGLGLALAESVLAAIRPDRPGASEVEAALDRFVTLAEANARSGYTDAALESLGLVARCFFPNLVAPLDRALAARGGPLYAYFWHGVGRAIYFLPVNFLPGYGSIAHAVAMARREAPDPGAARDAVAGVGYAVALVNLSHPGVLEHWLREHGDAEDDGAFTEGLVSSLVMRRATTPDDPDLAAFLDHRPDPATRAAALWQTMIAGPVAEAFSALGGDRGEGGERSTHPSLQGEVYRTVADLVAGDGAYGGARVPTTCDCGVGGPA